MNNRHFTLWSTLVAITACGFLFAAIAMENLFFLLLYYIVIVPSVRFVHFSKMHSVLRLVVLSAVTTPPLLVMATVGLANFSYVGLVLLVYVASFLAVALFEVSFVVNLLVVLVFWITVSLLSVLYPGTAPDRWGRTIENLLHFALFASVHSIIQLGLVAFIGRSLPRSAPVRHKDALREQCNGH